MSQDYREDWLSNFGKRMGLTTLAFNESRVCQLFLDNELIITIYKPDETGKLVFFGQLPIPHLPLEVAKQMLKRNRSTAKLSAPVISLSPEEDAIEVHVVLDQSDLEQGDEGIEKVIAELEYWRTASANDFQETAQEKVDYNVNFVWG